MNDENETETVYRALAGCSFIIGLALCSVAAMVAYQVVIYLFF